MELKNPSPTIEPAPSPFDDAEAIQEYDNLIKLGAGVAPEPSGTLEEPSLRQSMKMARDTTPDAAAKVVNIADRSGLTPSIIGKDANEIEKTQADYETDYRKLVKDSPKTAKWLTDENNAAIASDSVEALTSQEQSIKDMGFAETAARGIAYGTASGLAGVARIPGLALKTGNVLHESARDIFGGTQSEKIPNWVFNNPVAKYYDETAKYYEPLAMSQSFLDAIGDGHFEIAGKIAVATVAASLPLSLAAMATGAAGLPAAGFAAISGITASRFLKKAEDAGMSEVDASRYGTSQGVIEAATEMLQLHGLEKIAGSIAKSVGKDSAKRIFHEMGKSIVAQGLIEGTEETAASIGQDLTDLAFGVAPDLTIKKMAKNAIEAFTLGALSGSTTTGPMATFYGGSRGLNIRRLNKFQERRCHTSKVA